MQIFNLIPTLFSGPRLYDQILVPGPNLIQDQISDAPPQDWTKFNPKIHPYLISFSSGARL